MNEMVIKQSRKKILLTMPMGLAVILPGAWMLSLDAEFISSFPRFNSPLFVHALGISLITFTCISVLYGIRRLFGNRLGLIFNSSGIIDYTNGVSAVLIPWHEIKGAEIVNMRAQQLLAIKLNEPEKFLERQNRLRRTLLNLNYRFYGTPIVLPLNFLKTNPPELLASFALYQHKYGNTQLIS